MPSYLSEKDRKPPADSFSEGNVLPLKIKGAQPADSMGWSHVSRVAVETKDGSKSEIVLKRLKIKTRSEVQSVLAQNVNFYNLLKSFPGFQKFLPPTFHFIARDNPETEPQAYHLQPFIAGKALDQITDQELYSDTEVVRQLLELVNLLEAILAKHKRENLPRPDLLRTPRRAKFRAAVGGALADPRYTSNIMIADKPDQNEQRVFFVDTAQNGDERIGKFAGKLQIFISNLSQGRLLKTWKKKLESALAKNLERMAHNL